MKVLYSHFVIMLLFLNSNITCGQIQIKIDAKVDVAKHILFVNQELIYENNTEIAIDKIILNDWNNAFSAKNSPLAKRFSDEFVRSFYFSKEAERGFTNIISVESLNQKIVYNRLNNQIDLVEIKLEKSLLSKQKIAINIVYELKIPSEKFTFSGFDAYDRMYLKNCFLIPSDFQNNKFVTYSNENLDDCENAIFDIDMNIEVPKSFKIHSDLLCNFKDQNGYKTYVLSGKNRTDFGIHITPVDEFKIYKNDIITIETDLKSKNLDEFQKANVIDKIVKFTNLNIGNYPHEKILISQAEYDKNPFYGLNQLPNILSPFTNEFLFEIRFLKTYLNRFLKTSLQLDARQENWIYDGYQIYFMMKYMDEYYPNAKMMGSVAKYKLLKSFNLINLDFNEQYSYFYTLMARKNLDQNLGLIKSDLVKFNEQIALKYKAGLAFRYLDSYLESENFSEKLKLFHNENIIANNKSFGFESFLKSKLTKNIDWFFYNIVNNNKPIDFEFKHVKQTKDSIFFSIKNITKIQVPISVFGLQKKQAVFKKWYQNFANDSVFSIKKDNIDKLVLNYENEVIEFNRRNNYKKTKGFFINNRPFKFVFMKDLEDPKFNQILYVPTITYNLYDGISPGISLHNRTILDKPFNFNVTPSYAIETKSLTGFASFSANQNVFDSRLYRISYNFSGSYSHYAPNAGYSRLNPGIYFNFRDLDLRSNRKQLALVRFLVVDREPSSFLTNLNSENYRVLNFKFIDNKTELTKQFYYKHDLQFSKNFGKLASEIQFRKLFLNNRQVNLRLYVGAFLYNKTANDFFSFALDRPTDYLFDYDYIGRSENTGFVSQQLILTEGGFKSKLNQPFANQWIATTNTSFNVWNWVEVYGDLGFVKNNNFKQKFVYDSGVRFNLVTDYFELYFPIYSNIGWEILQPKYNEKVRFIVTLSPQILVNLFKRRWF